MEWLGNVRRDRDTEGHIATFAHRDIDGPLSSCGMTLRDVKCQSTRIPFSRRLFGEYKMMTTDNLLLTRSCMYLIEKPAHVA